MSLPFSMRDSGSAFISQYCRPVRCWDPPLVVAGFVEAVFAEAVFAEAGLALGFSAFFWTDVSNFQTIG